MDNSSSVKLCADLPTEPPDTWLERFDGRCYFYPDRDCPGWERDRRCGRIGTLIPKENTECQCQENRLYGTCGH